MRSCGGGGGVGARAPMGRRRGSEARRRCALLVLLPRVQPHLEQVLIVRIAHRAPRHLTSRDAPALRPHVDRPQPSSIRQRPTVLVEEVDHALRLLAKVTLAGMVRQPKEFELDGPHLGEQQRAARPRRRRPTAGGERNLRPRHPARRTERLLQPAAEVLRLLEQHLQMMGRGVRRVECECGA